MKNNIIIQGMVGFILLLSISLSYADSMKGIQWSQRVDEQNSNAVVYAFLSSKCPYCQHLHEFLKTYTAANPGFAINYYYIDKDKDALLRFNTFLQANQQTDFIVPSLYFCNSRWVGFNPAYQEQLIKGLTHCYQQLQKSQDLSTETIKTLENWATAYSLSPNASGDNQSALSLFILLFNDLLQSTLAILIALALLLVYRKSSSFIELCCVYIWCASITHYFIQSYAANYFKLLDYSHMISALVGMGMLLMYFRKSFIPQPRFIILLGGLTAVMVTFYSQLDNPNLALVFENWLKMHHDSPLSTTFWHLIYQTCYAVLFALVTAVLYGLVIRFKSFKNNELLWHAAGQELLALLGFTLIIYPSSMSYSGYMLISIFAVIMAAGVRQRFNLYGSN